MSGHVAWVYAHLKLCSKPILTQASLQRLLQSLSNFKLPLFLTNLRTYKEKLLYSEGQPTWSGYVLDCAISRCRKMTGNSQHEFTVADHA